MPVLINSANGLAENIPDEGAQAALGRGYHVPLNDPEGNPISAPYDEAQNLVKQGHTQPSSAQLQDLLDYKHFNEPSQQAISFVEGATEPLSLGLAGKAESMLGLSTPENILKRSEYNPGWNALGQTAGAVGSLLVAPEAGIPGLFGKAGAGAASKIAGEGLIAGAKRLAARGAVEGALYSIPHEVTEATLGDPNQTSESVMANLGLGSMLGAGFSLALGGLGAGLGKVLGHKAHMSQIGDDAAAVSHVPPGPDGGGGGGAGLQQKPTAVTWEAIPSTTFEEGKSLSKAPFEQRKAFTDQAASLIHDENGKDALAERLGISDMESTAGTGGYTDAEGTRHVSPNVISLSENVTPEQVSTYSKALQYIYKQDAVPYFKAHFAGGAPELPSGVLFSLKEPPNPENLKAFDAAIKDVFGPQMGYSQRGNELALINFDGHPNFEKSAVKLGEDYGEKLGIQGVGHFKSEGEYRPHDWAKDMDVGGIRNEAAPEGSPDLQKWLVGRRELFEKLLKERSWESKPPGSIQEILQRVKAAGEPETMPSKARLREAEDTIKAAGIYDPYPAHAAQYTSLEDPQARMQYKTLAEENSPTGEGLRDYEAGMKKTGKELLDKTVQDLSQQAVTSDEEDAGDRLIKGFGNQYQGEKEASAPFWQKFDKLKMQDIGHPGELVDSLERAIPGVTEKLKFNGVDGKVALPKWDSTLPWSKEVHSSINDVITAVNKEKLTLGDIRNVKNNIATAAAKAEAPLEKSQLQRIKSGLNSYIEEKIPDEGFREMNKRYAINEENRRVLEKIIGGKIAEDSPYHQQPIPENIVKRIFGNSKAVTAAKNLLPRDVFNEALANHLNIQIGKFTDEAKNGFSSNKFASWLGRNAPELRAAFNDNPESLSLIRAFTDKMRILPDSPPGNPSHTADKLLSILDTVKNVGSYFSKWGIASNVAQKLVMPTAEAKNQALLQALMEGKSGYEANQAVQNKFAVSRVVKTLDDYRTKISKKIDKGVESMFNPGGIAGGAASSYNDNQNHRELNAISEKVLNHSANPEALMEHLSGALQHVAPHAPQTAMALSTSVGSAVSFLSSKVPSQDRQSPLDAVRKPSQMEISEFNRYAQIVDNPASVLFHVEQGTILPQDVETLSTVYPKLYDTMKSKVLEGLSEHLSKKEPENIPYKTRLGMSLFLGQNLDSTLSPAFIMGNQQAFQVADAQQAAKEMQQHASQARMGKMKLGQMDQTASQRSAARRAIK